jgi:hypothetical protein
MFLLGYFKFWKRLANFLSNSFTSYSDSIEEILFNFTNKSTIASDRVIMTAMASVAETYPTF